MEILERFALTDTQPLQGIASLADVGEWRSAAHAVHIDSKVKRYIVDLVASTRRPHPYVAFGASPRASLGLAFVSRARAFIRGRDFVLPDDVRAVARSVMAHRVAFTPRLSIERVHPGDFVETLIASVAAP